MRSEREREVCRCRVRELMEDSSSDDVDSFEFRRERGGVARRGDGGVDFRGVPSWSGGISSSEG